MRKIVKLFTLAAVLALTSLSLISCDLLNGISTDDLMDKIDKDIAWANAEKAAVTVAYPQSWGFSPQVTGFGDVRIGYEFDLGFTPSDEYALLGWQAYATADLPEDWMLSPDPYLAAGGSRLIPQIDFDSVILPQVAEGGGTGKVKINTTDPVTLIPYCRNQPRIISIIPNASRTLYSRNQQITIRFAAPLETEVLDMMVDEFGGNAIQVFGYGIIEATGQPGTTRISLDGVNSGTVNYGNAYYQKPVYNPYNRTITINPRNNDLEGIKNGPPSNSEVTLRLGSNFRNAGSLNTWKDSYQTFTWRVAKTDCYVGNWHAKYNNGKIRITWIQEGADAAKLRYKTGSGSVVTISDIPHNPSSPLEEYEYELSVGSGVFDPAQNNGEGYEIWIDLVSEGDTIEMEEPSIRIWNIEDMEVDSSKPAIGIKDEAGLMAIKLNDPGQIYGVDNDFAITSQWIPAGNSGAPLKGKFYGMGKTVTFSNTFAGFASAQNTGLFGYVEGARIQDLTVVYSRTVTANYAGGTAYIGGIVGSVAGSAVISNCTVKGGTDVILQNNSSSSNVYLGGMVGIMQGGVLIENSTAALNVELSNGSGSEINIGGMVGRVNDGTGRKLSNLTVTGNVTVKDSPSIGKIHAGGVVGTHQDGSAGALKNISYGGTVSIDNCSSAEDIWAGGITSWCRAANFENCNFIASGNIVIGTIVAASRMPHIGGIVGHMASTSSLLSCNSYGQIKITRITSANSDIGGIAGSVDTNNSLSGCDFTGNINIITQINSTGNIGMGGIAGSLNSNLTLSDCNFSGTMNIGAITSASSFIGGIFGQKAGSGALNNCDSGGDIEITSITASGQSLIGGICGVMSNTSLSNCNSSGDIGITTVTSPSLRIGGIGGNIHNGTSGSYSLSHCDSHGNIEIGTVTSTYSYIGGIGGYITGAAAFSACNTYGNIKITDDKSSGELCVGGVAGVAGYTNYGGAQYLTGSINLSDCNSRGVIEVASTANNFIAGGVVGYVNGFDSGTQITFTNCNYQNSDTVSISAACSGSNYLVDVGGIVANAEKYASFIGCKSNGNLIQVNKTGAGSSFRIGGFGGTLSNSTVTLSNCGSTSKVTTTSEITGSNIQIGGFAGYLYPSVTGCWSTGDVSTWSQGTAYVGGFAGEHRNIPTDCWSTGNVSSTASSALYMGGLIGYAYYGVRNSYATGNVTASNGSGILYTGGLVGNAYDLVSRSWASGKVTAAGTGAGNVYSGGLVGYIINYTVENCYALGDVDASTTGSGGVNAGGLVGYAGSGSTVQYSFAQGSVEAKSSGSAIAGGVVGRMEGNSINNTAALGKVIIATSASGTPGAWRIYGDFPDAQSDNNYARVTMMITGTNTPPAIPAATYIGIDARNGGDVSVRRTAEGGFWTGSGSEMGYSASYWNFTEVTTVGHPKLGIGTEDETPVEIPYNITPSAASNGSFTITAPGTDGTTAPQNTTVTITATPDSNYQVGTVTVTPTTGLPPIVNGTGSYTFTMPASDVTVSVTFKLITYTVTRGTAPTGGTFTLNDKATNLTDVAAGSPVTIKATPTTAGYSVATITVGGTSIPKSSWTETGTATGIYTYTFTMPASNVAVNVTFSNIYNVITNPVSGGGGSISTLPPTTGTYNNWVSFKVSANTGYGLILSNIVVIGSGGSVTVNDQGSGNYRFRMPAYDVTVSVTFTPNTYTLNLPVPSGGSATVKVNGVTVSDGASVKTGDTVTVTPSSPQPGYGAGAVTVTSSTIGTITPAGGVYTIPGMASTATVTVSVTFTPNTYTLNLPVPTGGTAIVTVNGTIVSGVASVKTGDTITVTPVPASGYSGGTVTVTSSTIGTITPAGGEYTIPGMVSTATVTVNVEFDPDPSP